MGPSDICLCANKQGFYFIFKFESLAEFSKIVEIFLEFTLKKNYYYFFPTVQKFVLPPLPPPKKMLLINMCLITCKRILVG
jgi:hypothetical protein